MAFLDGFMGFHDGFMGFHGGFMGCQYALISGGLMGFNGMGFSGGLTGFTGSYHLVTGKHVHSYGKSPSSNVIPRKMGH